MDSPRAPSPTVMLLYPNHVSSGNASTIGRIRQHVENCGFLAIAKNLEDFLVDPGPLELCCLLTIHAVHSHPVLAVMNQRVPLVLIFGGTDLNHHVSCEQDRYCMEQVVQRAVACVVFSQTMADIAAKFWPHYAEKVWIISQGVTTTPSAFNLREAIFRSRGASAKHIVLLVAGIRAVKDPLFLVKAFAEWHNSHPDTYLVIVGPLRDSSFGQLFLQKIQQLGTDGVLYLGALSVADTHAAIQQSTVLVNSSLSEGMSTAILEAWDLGTIVVARDVIGNRSLVEHNRTGFLYSTPKECLEIVASVISDKDMVARITQNASHQLSEKHSYQNEAFLYQQLLRKCIPTTSCG